MVLKLHDVSLQSTHDRASNLHASHRRGACGKNETRQFRKRLQPSIHFSHQHICLALREEHHVFRQGFWGTGQFCTEVKQFVLDTNNRFVQDGLHALDIGSLSTVFVAREAVDFSQHHPQPTVGFIAASYHAETGVGFLAT